MIGVPGSDVLAPAPVLGVRPSRERSSDGTHGAVQVLYRVYGRGTRLLASLGVGAMLHVLGPPGPRLHDSAGRRTRRSSSSPAGSGSAPFPAFLAAPGPLRAAGVHGLRRALADELPLLIGSESAATSVTGRNRRRIVGDARARDASARRAASRSPAREPCICTPAVRRRCSRRSPTMAQVRRRRLRSGARGADGLRVRRLPRLRRPDAASPPDGPVAYERVCLEGPVMPADASGLVSPDLSVAVGSVRLKNPVLTASGTFGYGLEFLPFMKLSELGGIVTKGLSPNAAQGESAGADRRDARGDAERDRPPERRRRRVRHEQAPAASGARHRSRRQRLRRDRRRVRRGSARSSDASRRVAAIELNLVVPEHGSRRA